MALTNNKRASNAKYLLKCDAITIRPPMEKGQAYRDAAADAGKSLQGYIMDALDAYASGEAVQAVEDAGRVRFSISAKALAGLCMDGETEGQAAARLFSLAVDLAHKASGQNPGEYIPRVLDAAKVLADAVQQAPSGESDARPFSRL